MLERSIGMQLEFATLEGLVIPTYSDSDTLHNTDCVERTVNYFLASEQNLKASPSSMPLRNVCKLVNSYMEKIASDVNFKHENMHLLAKALSGSSRSVNDGLYRALDIYFELHMKTALCNVLNTHKDPVATISHGGTSRRGGWVNLVREIQVLRVRIERMRTRVHQLKDESNNLKQEMKRISQTYSSLGSPRFLANTFGVCKVLKRDVENNGLATPRVSANNARDSHHFKHCQSFSHVA
ncbi:BTB/POZ domain-containing protein isoform X2 [Tanacetum coccineum]